MHHRPHHHRRRSFDEPGHVHELTFSRYRRYRLLSAERAAEWRWSSAGWYEGEPTNDLRPDPIPPEWCDE